jgi:hypothetical protein
MDSYLSYVGVAGSAVSMLTTCYFWLVRMKQERPCLRPYLVDKELFLGASRDDNRQIGVKLGIIVANYSVLPNAILGARLWARTHDAWQEVGGLAFDKATPQPFNVAPLQTVLLRLNGSLWFAYQDALEEGSKTVANYVAHHLRQPLQWKLELRQLNDRVDTHVLTAGADAGCAKPELRIVAPAA